MPTATATKQTSDYRFSPDASLDELKAEFGRVRADAAAGVLTQENAAELMDRYLTAVESVTRRIEDERDAAREAAKNGATCPIDFAKFVDVAKPLSFNIVGAKPKVFSSGGFGWFANGKQDVKLPDGQEIRCQVQLTVSCIASNKRPEVELAKAYSAKAKADKEAADAE